ncbi:aldehyde dehydrogenase family protein [Streptosporangium sp. NPDC006013]|uniref:aldehyde dehydrogenase family protein n=1 Tax=Streptosporangium sp. NPDC006013 TaxID=3155596 RepID=UPI0033A286C7
MKLREIAYGRSGDKGDIGNRRIAGLLAEYEEEPARLVVAEAGSPISLARTLQARTPSVNSRWEADAAENPPTQEAPVRSKSVLLRRPIGVVTTITPYDHPINMIAWKAGRPHAFPARDLTDIPAARLDPVPFGGYRSALRPRVRVPRAVTPGGASRAACCGDVTCRRPPDDVTAREPFAEVLYRDCAGGLGWTPTC